MQNRQYNKHKVIKNKKMKRKLTITIEDDFTNQKVSASVDLDEINNLFKTTGINGITDIVLQTNTELNCVLSQKFDLLVPTDLSILNSKPLPPEKSW